MKNVEGKLAAEQAAVLAERGVNSQLRGGIERLEGEMRRRAAANQKEVEGVRSALEVTTASLR